MSQKNLKYSKIFHTFQVKSKLSEAICEYQVRYLPKKFFETAIELMVRNYLPEVAVMASKGVHKSKSATEEVTNYWRIILDKEISLACFRKEDPNELVTVNILTISLKDETFDISKVNQIKFKKQGVNNSKYLSHWIF